MFAVFGSIFVEIQLPAAFLTELNEKITLVFEMLTVLKTAYKCSGLRLRLHQSKCFRIRDESETFWRRWIRFAVYTQNVNPESKLCSFVMNPKTFESGTSSGNIVSGYLRIRIPL